MFKINFKSLLLPICIILWPVMGFVLGQNNSNSVINWCSIETIIIASILAFQIFVLIICKPKGNYLIIALWVIIYLFHFSHIFLNSIEYDFASNKMNNVFTRYSFIDIKAATNMSLNFIYALFLGTLSFFLLGKNINFTRTHMSRLKKNKDLSNHNHFILGIIFVLIGLPFDIYMIFIRMVTVNIVGYYGITQVNISYLYQIISDLMVPGMILILTSTTTKVKKEIFLIIFVLYKFISMFTGLRAYNLITMSVVLYVYIKYNGKFQFKIKYLIIIPIVTQLLGGILVGVRESRVTGVDISTIIKYIFDFRENIIFQCMGEFGITLNVVTHVYSHTKSASGGTQLFEAFATMIPGVSHIFSGIDWGSTSLAKRYDIGNLGGSFVADAFFDFKYGGLFLCFIFGILISSFFYKFEKNIIQGNFQKVAFVSPILVEVIFCVRSSTLKLPRMILWYSIIYIFFTIILNKIKTKEN